MKNLLSGKSVKLRAKSKEGKIYSSEYVFEDTGKYVNLKRIQTEKISLGKCPKCGGDVFESDKNFYCSNKCGFAIWKEDKFNKISITAANVKDVLEGKPFCKIKKQVGGNPLKVKATPYNAANKFSQIKLRQHRTIPPINSHKSS